MLLGSALFTAWAAAVAWFDCRDRRVANGLVAAGVVAALGCAVAHASPLGVTSKQAVIGLAVGLLVLLPFFGAGVMGAADVKVFSALGAWCGVSALLDLWVVASLAAAVHALALLIAARVRAGAACAWTLRGHGTPTFAVGSRRGAPYAALLVGAASLYWLGHVLQRAAQ